MDSQDIIVIGASAGGVEALQFLVAGFPADLNAAVFIVLHIGAGMYGESLLPQILTRAGPLPARHPADGEPIDKGRIYVAPPDRHLLLAPGHVHLSRAPKENRTRPAINPLFRSAAAAYRARVTGVILTGLLDDGVAGLAEIGRRGGVTIVQDPDTALYPDMPSHALKHVEVDYVLPLPEIPGILYDLARSTRSATEREEPMEKTLTEFSCPDCRGPIWEERQGGIVEYRCRVGHAYSALSMATEYHETAERSLWATVVALEQAADAAERLAPELGPESGADVRRKRAQAATLKEMLDNASE